uniref:P-type ATPase A domain-containing protein n=1 Tax=Acrobeloides nanus TaxID=290746 RepID=A0A914C2H9_9BILA
MYNRNDKQNGNRTQAPLPHINPPPYRSNDESIPRNPRKWFDSKRAPVPRDSSRARNLNATFCEQTWDADRIDGFFKNSRINTRFPDKSRGLTDAKAKVLLEVVRGFQNLLPEKCTVIRDGIDKLIFAAEVVVGDIIKIQSGVRVPADARILV